MNPHLTSTHSAAEIDSPRPAPDAGGSFGIHSRERWQAHLREYGLRFRLLVVADSAAEAIANTGGLLFDAHAAGWDAIVATPDCRAVRGLEVLGAVVLELGAEPAATLIQDVDPHVLALPTPEHPLSDLTPATVYWSTRPPVTREELSPAVHALSMASTAFKHHAMRIAGLDDPVTTVESFRMRPFVHRRGLPRSLGLTFPAPAPR